MIDSSTLQGTSLADVMRFCLLEQHKNQISFLFKILFVYGGDNFHHTTTRININYIKTWSVLKNKWINCSHFFFSQRTSNIFFLSLNHFNARLYVHLLKWSFSINFFYCLISNHTSLQIMHTKAWFNFFSLVLCLFSTIYIRTNYN